MRWIPLVCALPALVSLACDDGAPPVDTARPAAVDPVAILEFIDSRAYAGPGWRAETAEPRPETTAVSPHDRVQVFQNEALITGRQGDWIPPDSMAVKVMYDGDQIVGHAFLWQLPDTVGITWLCYGPTNRCGYLERAHPRESPVFGTGSAVVCGQCHGGLVFTEITP